MSCVRGRYRCDSSLSWIRRVRSILRGGVRGRDGRIRARCPHFLLCGRIGVKKLVRCGECLRLERGRHGRRGSCSPASRIYAFVPVAHHSFTSIQPSPFPKRRSFLVSVYRPTASVKRGCGWLRPVTRWRARTVKVRGAQATNVSSIPPGFLLPSAAN